MDQDIQKEKKERKDEGDPATNRLGGRKKEKKSCEGREGSQKGVGFDVFSWQGDQERNQKTTTEKEIEGKKNWEKEKRRKETNQRKTHDVKKKRINHDNGTQGDREEGKKEKKTGRRGLGETFSGH